jgi:putative ABC transport system permease protein
VLLFSAGLVVLSVFAFGLGPALQFVSTDLQTELKEGVKGTASGQRMRWRTCLAASELALAVVLLVGAGLMIRSLYRLLSVDSGFQAAHVVKFELSLRSAHHKTDPQLVAFWQRLVDGVRAIPGVEVASLGTGVPLTGDHSRTDIQVEGRPPANPGSNPHPDVHIVSPGYEKTLGIRLMRGRGFGDADQANGLRVAMVNSLIAKRLFAGEDPVGKRFTFGRVTNGTVTKWITIVGVLADTKMYGLANPARLEVYIPVSQIPQDGMTLLVKSTEEPQALITAVRGAVGAIDKQQPIFDISTMQEVVKASVSTRRVTLVLLGLFSGLTLLLAAIGIYGVISYSVAQREKEIGIRIALGARRGDVLQLVLRQGVKIVGAGIVCGAAASVLLTRMMKGLLYSVSSADPMTFAAVVAGLVVVAFAACYVPARRMLRLDPLVALRQE